MSTNTTGFNIQRFLRGLNDKVSGVKVPTAFTSNNTSTNTSTNINIVKSSFSRIIGYLLAILIIILVILLFINFFITPIFRLKPGGPGIIPVPGFDDGKLFWNKTSPGMIENKDIPIANLAFDYTVNLDVFVQNPLQFSTSPRVFFTRGGIIKPNSSGDTLLNVLDNYNLAAALLPDTNDLIVSVLNVNNNMENVIISNIPVQETFRLTIVVLQQGLEVYINGNLIKTRMFSAPPKSVLGDIYPSSGVEINVTKVRNLKIWSRILTISEIKQSTPSLSKSNDFGADSIPSTSCLSSKLTNSVDRISKLTVDSISDETSKLL
jgi:hypothetical protein